ncbi:MAG: sulfotransferase [Thiobacillus sp.]|nr:sulfotransferase [Thiobacillus sp.]
MIDSNFNFDKNPVFIPPSFIVGVPRSGTTLLSAILNRNSQVCVTPETHYYSIFHSRIGHESLLNSNWPSTARRCLYLVDGLREMGLTSEDIIKAADTRRTRAGILSSIGELYAAKRGKQLWIEKTPQHMLYLSEIWHDFPQARILHILRDGRDVALSLSKMDWANPGFLHNLYKWSKELEEAESYLSDPRCLTIRYEELLSTPAATVATVCRFLGIAYEEKMLVPDGSEEGLIETGMSHKNNILQPIMANNKKKWAAKLSPELTAVADHIFGDAISRHGYERHVSQDSPTAKSHITIPRHIFFQSSPDDVRVGALTDRDAERLTRNGWSIKFSKNATCLLDTRISTACVITSSKLPKLGHKLRSPYWRLVLLFEWRLRLRELKHRGAIILWLRDPTTSQHPISLAQKYADTLFKKYASACVRLPHHDTDGIVVGTNEFFQLLESAR